MSEIGEAMRVFRNTKRPRLRVRACLLYQSTKPNILRRIEGVESEIQYLRRQLDEMRDLLKESHSYSIPESGVTHSPSQDRQQVCRESACGSSRSHHHHSEVHTQEGLSSVPIASPAGYPSHSNNHQYQRPMPGSMPGSRPTLSPNELPVQSVYQASNQIITRPPKRKRSGFEVRDEPIADFIDKGLITLECAVSYFDTYVCP